MEEKIREIRKYIQDIKHDMAYFAGIEEAEHAASLLDVIDTKIKELNSYDCSH